MAKQKTNKKTISLPEDKQKALELAKAAVEKEFGKGIVVTNQDHQFPEIERISSGCLGLDKALGGGYPRGRIIEIYGAEAAGKSTLALHAVVECQRQGGIALYVDVEHAFDPVYAESLGIDINQMMICQPSSGEEALNVADTFARSGAVDLIVIDSVAALVPRSELEGDIGDSNIASQARLMSQAMRMLVGPIHRTNTLVIFINQLRQKAGLVFGNPEVTSGGGALKYFSSQRLDIRKIDNIKTSEEQTGIRSRVKVVKNKVGAPFRTAEFNIMFGAGIDWAMDILDSAVAADIIKKSGAWFSFKGNMIGQGANNTALAIRENQELADELKQLLKNNKKPIPVEVEDESITQDD